MEAAQVFINGWVDEQLWYIYTMEYYSAVKKKKISLSATAWMELKNIMLIEISQSEKTNTIWFRSYVETNEQTELSSKIRTDS